MLGRWIVSAERRDTTRIVGAVCIVALIIAMGTAGFSLLGDGRWSLADALYMTVITISTVGFAEVLPELDQVPGARAWTMVLIVVGSGGLLYLTSVFTASIIEGDLGGVLRRRRMEKRIAKLEGHVVVCGCGATGWSVVESLLHQARTVVAIDQNLDKLERLHAEHSDVLFVLGDATSEDVLQRARVHRAYGLVAALSDDRDDLYLVFTTRLMNPDVRIVAKTVDPDNSAKMQRAGAEVVVSPASIGGAKLAAAVGRPSVSHFVDRLAHDNDEPHHIDEIRVPQGSPLAGKTLARSEIRSTSALVLGIREASGEVVYNPRADTVLSSGQTLIVMVDGPSASALRALVSGARS